MSQVMDVFQLCKQHNLLLIVDLPTKDNEAYSKLSQEIVLASHETAICFFQMEIPNYFSKAALANITQRAKIADAASAPDIMA